MVGQHVFWKSHPTIPRTGRLDLKVTNSLAERVHVAEGVVAQGGRQSFTDFYHTMPYHTRQWRAVEMYHRRACFKGLIHSFNKCPQAIHCWTSFGSFHCTPAPTRYAHSVEQGRACPPHPSPSPALRWSDMYIREDPAAHGHATGAPSQTSTVPYHTTPCVSIEGKCLQQGRAGDVPCAGIDRHTTSCTWPSVVPIGEDPAAHGHWCAFTDLYHTIPYHTIPWWSGSRRTRREESRWCTPPTKASTDTSC